MKLPLVLLILASSSFALPAAEVLRAAAAKIDITPEKPVLLAGYESRKELSRGVHDPLAARALAFRQGDRHLVLVSIDNLGFYNNTAEPLREAILSACGLQPAELLLCAIHTHSAPTLMLDEARGHKNNVDYTKALGTKLAILVREALGKLTPAELSLGKGASPVGVNRRELAQDDSGKTRVVLGRNTDTLTDREVQVLQVTGGAGGEPIAILFGYSTHSTSLGPGNYMVSGDIHGLAEQCVEKYREGRVVALGFAGASGDIDPWVRVLPGFRTENGWLPEPVLMGTFLGQEVARAAEGCRKIDGQQGIKCLFARIELPGKESEAGPAEGKKSVPISISVARVGELAFVGFGGEVFNQIGRAIKDRSRYRNTFVFTHCNGAAGYIPTREAYAEGGYEVKSSPFGPGASERLIEKTLDLLKELQ